MLAWKMDVKPKNDDDDDDETPVPEFTRVNYFHFWDY